MKKTYSVILLLAMMVAALTFAACGNDDKEESGDDNTPTATKADLIGIWDLLYTMFFIDGAAPEREDGRGVYWEFTEDKAIIHNLDDLMNNVPLSYIIMGEQLTVGSYATFTILEFTTTKLVLRFIGEGEIYEMTFRKRG